ncbi:sterol desaturase family protein [Bradyrhizobium sp. IC4061]|uniref:sterol desaturase family protein n=1 Tax=unclassified Bradyrhizobium TaxID=2631580 RepID=UPI001CD4011F|nr:sterol desaturase family protein [Bradyrhizobium sp. IC4060]MCA1489018.1 sterol desaturase family protein [Bradyrhizobium sp. IC4061]
MDDTLYGTRDKRGNWTPNKRPKRSPIFVWPVQPKRLLRWLFGYPGYLWPWNALYFAISLVVWVYLTPSLETMREFSPGWISLILLRNAALTLLFYGGFHTVLYIQRRQEADFKYTAKWPDTDNSTFLFGSQTAENVFWTMCSGVPVWTAYEVFIWWTFANGYISYVDFREQPVYFIAVMLLVPMWHSLHFYVVHRLIHIGPLYQLIHKVHHHNVNPGPWSGLSMHTFEHIVYFSGVLIHFLVPSHPLHAMFQLIYAALTPEYGHLGFDRIVIGDKKSIDTDSYFHHLHHKYFEVNYGTQLIPLDEWFGTAHDGSPEADQAIYKRMKAKKYARRV